MDSLMFLAGTLLPGSIGSRNSYRHIVWEKLPKHPTVMKHSSPSHREIVSLGVSDGHLLIAYGDWTNNLGPAQVIGYDLDTLQPVILTPGYLMPNVASEAWHRIIIINGKAYLPHTDPKVGNQAAFTTNERGFWEVVKFGGIDSMIHVFDMAIFKGRMLICGSANLDPPVSGVGRGTVWQETYPGSRKFEPVLYGTSRAGFARFYNIHIHPEGNEVRVRNYAGGLETWMSTDGRVWQRDYENPPLNENIQDPWMVPDPVDLPDGYAETTGLNPLMGATYHDGYLYVSGGDAVVMRTKLTEL